MIQEREECSRGEKGCAEAMGLWCSGTGRGLPSCTERPGSPEGVGSMALVAGGHGCCCLEYSFSDERLT